MRSVFFTKEFAVQAFGYCCNPIIIIFIALFRFKEWQQLFFLMHNPKLHLVNRVLEYRKRRSGGIVMPNYTSKSTNPRVSESSFKKGTEFESFIVRLFSPDYFTLVEWRSDKSIDGISPIMSKFPDLEFYFESHNESLQFAVECKWRACFKNERVDFNKFHLENYRYYQEQMQIPTFLVLGVGNTPSHPRSVYILPLRDISKECYHEFELNVFLRSRSDGPMFLDCSRLTLT